MHEGQANRISSTQAKTSAQITPRTSVERFQRPRRISEKIDREMVLSLRMTYRERAMSVIRVRIHSPKSSSVIDPPATSNIMKTAALS